MGTVLLRRCAKLLAFNGMKFKMADPMAPTYNTFSIRDFKQKLKEFGGGGQVLLEKNNETGLAVITLKHQEKKNSITGPMIADLADIVSDLEEWTMGKGLVLWGGENAFCSGADLHLVRRLVDSAPAEGGNALAWTMHNLLTCLHQLPMVSVALVCGVAMGGGAELTTACDFRLVAPSAEVHFVHARMGLVPGWGGGTRLVRLVGPTQALEMLLGAKKLDAEEAVRLGFASAVVPPGDTTLQGALQWLQQRTKGDATVVRAMKGIVTQATLLPLDQSLSAERQAFAGLWGGPLQMNALERNLKHR